MPEFTGIDTNGEEFIDLEFDVYCSTCGGGLCSYSQASSRYGKHRLDVEACPGCMEKKDNEIELLKDQIGSLEYKIETLESEIDSLNMEIRTLQNNQ